MPDTMHLTVAPTVVKFLGAQYSESDSDPRDVVVCAAGSMPGDLHKLWRTRDPKGYHVEYGYSCMATELVTAVQEGIKIITVLVQDHGSASIGSLSESLGSQRLGTKYRYRNPQSGRLDGDKLPVDLAANAASLGVEMIKTTTPGEFAEAIKAAKAADHSVVIYVETDPLIGAPDSESWWDVPVSETSTLDSTQQAPKTYDEHKATQKLYL
jgi:3D-(3,5/4)-trihydroxycyclohexane-1,2-dione acylhydrolase (decyclizing)